MSTETDAEKIARLLAECDAGQAAYASACRRAEVAEESVADLLERVGRLAGLVGRAEQLVPFAVDVPQVAEAAAQWMADAAQDGPLAKRSTSAQTKSTEGP